MSLKKALCTLLIGAAVGMLGGCGGGGSKVENTVVTGVVSKGIFTSGTVRVYAVAADGTKTLLKEDTIKAGGVYTADLGSAYTGPIQVEAFGTYTDEATNTSISIPDTAPLKAAVPSTATATTVVVTPLTDLAVRKATTDGKLTVSAIAGANSDVATLFGVDNIVTTKPVTFDNATLKAAAPAQQKYTEVLALVSQYVANAATATPTSADLQSSLTKLSGAITLSSGTAAPQLSSLAVAADLATAVNDVMNGANTSAVLAADATAKSNLAPVVGIGTNKIVSYTFNVSGVTGSVIGGLQADVALPGLGVADGEIGSAALTASGVFSGTLLGNVKSNVLTLGLFTTNLFGNGNFATLYLKVPATTTVPASQLGISNVKVVDFTNSTTIDAAVVTVADGPSVSIN